MSPSISNSSGGDKRILETLALLVLCGARSSRELFFFFFGRYVISRKSRSVCLVELDPMNGAQLHEFSTTDTFETGYAN